MKSLLKIGSGIVILVVLFFALFSIFLPGKKDATEQAKTQEQAKSGSGIQSMDVTQTETGVLLEIVGVESANYTVTADDERTLTIHFSSSPLSLERKMIPLPHPMVELIEAEEDGTGSKVKVTLTEGFTHQEEYADNILLVKLNKIGAQGQDMANAEEIVEQPVAPQPKAVVRKSVVRKSKPRPAAKSAPAAPEPDDLISELGFDDAPVADQGLGSNGGVDDFALGTEEDLGFNDSAAVQPDDLALNQDLGDGGFTDDAASIDDAFAGGDPAQPSIDASSILANLPSITNISVSGDGKVSISHEGGRLMTKQFLRRPNQAVVELKDVSLNRLQVSQSAGGNVQGIKTEQFVNPEGSSIARVFIMLSQMPDSRDNIIVKKGKGSVNVEVQGP